MHILRCYVLYVYNSSVQVEFKCTTYMIMIVSVFRARMRVLRRLTERFRMYGSKPPFDCIGFPFPFFDVS